MYEPTGTEVLNDLKRFYADMSKLTDQSILEGKTEFMADRTLKLEGISDSIKHIEMFMGLDRE